MDHDFALLVFRSVGDLCNRHHLHLYEGDAGKRFLVHNRQATIHCVVSGVHLALHDLLIFGAESPYIVDAGRQSDRAERAERGRLLTSTLGLGMKAMN